jgi:Holliday junction DNA helicase RuvA
MIARLSGRIAEVGEDQCVLDVAGVGYLLFCSRRTLDRLGTAGAAAALFVETHVREDHIHLYGFIDRAERDWFRLLQTVQGVGGRVALAVLGVLTPERLAGAIAAQDKAALTRADGVGPKLAGRIVAELRDKVAAIALAPAGALPGAPAAVPPPEKGPIADAVSALVNLGYGRADAFAAVATAAGRLGGTGTVEQLIPAALRELAG